jgi:hypothetical protein
LDALVEDWFVFGARKMGGDFDDSFEAGKGFGQCCGN